MPWLHSNSRNAGHHADIHIQVREIQQLFNSFDPTPFPDRDLDERAEEFITGWAMEHPTHLPLRLKIRLSQPADPSIDAKSVGESVRHYFEYRAGALGRQLRQLLALGRTSLAVGLVCLALSISAAHLIALHNNNPWISILRESLVIGGWVAMWRPLQIFLYDWWPIQLRRKLCIRLARADVELTVPMTSAEVVRQPKSPSQEITPLTRPTDMRDAPVAGSK